MIWRGTLQSSVGPERLFFGVGGSDVHLEDALMGTVLAPNARVELKPGVFTGAVVGRTVALHQEHQFVHVPYHLAWQDLSDWLPLEGQDMTGQWGGRQNSGWQHLRIPVAKLGGRGHPPSRNPNTWLAGRVARERCSASSPRLHERTSDEGPHAAGAQAGSGNRLQDSGCDDRAGNAREPPGALYLNQGGES